MLVRKPISLLNQHKVEKNLELSGSYMFSVPVILMSKLKVSTPVMLEGTFRVKVA